MDSFISLFDPGLSNEPSTSRVKEGEEEGEREGSGEEMGQDHLPPEPQMGNVEYKLKLVNPSRQRFEHLVTQVS